MFINAGKFCVILVISLFAELGLTPDCAPCAPCGGGRDIVVKGGYDSVLVKTGQEDGGSIKDDGDRTVEGETVSG
jgi:hypothetical protein